MDRPFYDSLLRSNDEARQGGYEIILCEEVWTESGGKQSAVQIFDVLRRRGRLKQNTKRVQHCVAFALDADFDGVLSRKKHNPHIIYTEAHDVEAEVFVHGDLSRALCVSLSLTMSKASILANQLTNFVEDLALAWKEWITLCCLAAAMRSHSPLVRAHKPSTINIDKYGGIDVAKLNTATADVRARKHPQTPATIERWVRSRVEGMYKRSAHRTLVSGKSVPAYLHWRIEPLLGGDVVDLNSFQQTITHLMLTTVDFKDVWASYYHDKFRDLLTNSS